ncbi:hypothetical protein [uncultured Kordia sp.]|uniref:hypothetical protein n=1 Tax=uncultured Kordia sp. TaxID=507699 RepID=UPI002622FD8A|nr:hypothetical protein [uncultured Kordia sp.]
MKRLQLKKVKISRITNPHLIIAGGNPPSGNDDKNTSERRDCRHTKDDNDVACNDQTNNGGTLGRTGLPGSGSNPSNSQQV